MVDEQPTVQVTDEGLQHTVARTGHPIGLPVPGWAPRLPPRPALLEGRYCRLEAWDAGRHAGPLFAALHRGPPDETEARWTYLPEGPFPDQDALAGWLDRMVTSGGWWPLVLVVTDGGTAWVQGTASYLRVDVGSGTVEVGGIVYSGAVQRSRAATEAMYLMARHAVTELGYRRYEWKCDALNRPSRAAALRLGLRFEGLWRQAAVYKGRNRDTAWFAFTDTDFEALAPAYLAWLDPANFDADGRQLSSLSAGTAAPGPSL